MATGLARALELARAYAGQEGVWFDLLIGGITRDQYEALSGEDDVIHRDPDGTLTYGKRIHLDGGTVTVETIDERAAA